MRYSKAAGALAYAAGAFAQISTSSGPVSGHAAPSVSGVQEYLGIPFAQPPVGNLRFAAPQAYSGTAAINGSSFGYSCPAFVGAFGGGNYSNLANVGLTYAGATYLSGFGQFADTMNEDCLTLNVWAPSTSTGDAKKAVMIWIYGGGFASGNSDLVTYRGQYMAAAQDVIVVSFNYRLNVYGFAGAPNLPNQNVGLLDQRLAIEWVRNNIAAFGGDVNRIIIFGESAGAASVDYYTYAYTKDPIISGAIMESGTAALLTSAPSDAANTWYYVTNRVGCGNASSADQSAVLACMRTKSTSDLNTAVTGIATQNIANRTYQFNPVIDGVTVFGDTVARAQAGNLIKVPLLIGNNNYEAGLFKLLYAIGGVYYSDAFWDIFNTVIFTCPASQRANVSIDNAVPTWRYRYFGEFPNTELSTMISTGAFHTSEIPAIFNTFPSDPSSNNIPANTAAQNSISAYMQGAWATFAKNPSTGLNSYQGGWPQYYPNTTSLIQLGYNNLTGTNLVSGNSFDLTCNTNYAVTVGPTTNTTSSGGKGGGAAAAAAAGEAAAAAAAAGGGRGFMRRREIMAFRRAVLDMLSK